MNYMRSWKLIFPATLVGVFSIVNFVKYQYSDSSPPPSTAASEVIGKFTPPPDTHHEDDIKPEESKIIDTKKVASENFKTKLDDLLKSNNKKAKLDIFDLLDKCSGAPRLPSISAQIPNGENYSVGRQLYIEEWKHLSEACLNVPASLISRRGEFLEAAITDGVPGAATRYYRFGPNGNWDDATNRPEDLFVIEWQRRAKAELEKASMAGDIEAIGLMASVYEEPGSTEGERVKALAAEIALRRSAAQDGRNTLHHDRLISNLKKDLTPSSISEANELSSKLFTACCEKQGGNK